MIQSIQDKDAMKAVIYADDPVVEMGEGSEISRIMI